MEGKGKLMIVGLLLAALNMTVFTEEWKASTVPTLNALVTSCVVLPCSFTHPKDGLPTSRLRGTWHLLEDKNSKIYHADSAKVLDNYKGRTSLSGNLSQGNCTLQIVNVKDHDNGPFCFRIELIDHMGVENSLDKFSFVKDCVSINMLNEPPKPTLTHAKAAIEGHPFTVTCSVTHSCPFRPPTLQWSRGEPEHITERETQRGTWEVQSILVIIPEENDNFQEVTCTATFDGGATSSSQLTLYVKRIENYNHIIIPAVVGVATIAIIGGVCLFILKKYKDQITALQSQDGSMWNRLSRMSRRFHSRRPEHCPANQRRPKVETVDQGRMYNHVTSKSCADQKTSKPPFPSPKSQLKSYSCTEELVNGDFYEVSSCDNVYGNL